MALALLLAGCGAEKRPAGPDQPQSAPNGPTDPRAAAFETNKYQLSEGGRYFTWYGCGSCHGGGATGPLDLGDGQWVRGGGFDQVYRSIVDAHPGQTPSFSDAIPAQQLWQITAYVRALEDLPPEKRRRQDMDQTGEPQASNWSGPVQ